MRGKLRFRAVALALAGGLCASATRPAWGAEALRLYVHPEGNNTWSGRLADPKAGRPDGPVATIAGARDRLRRLRKTTDGLKQPVTVEIAQGTYRISRTISFGPQDAGTEQAPIEYKAAPGAIPVISGAITLDNWRRRADGKPWTLNLPDSRKGKWRFNQLHLDGKRLTPARWPDTKWYRFEKKGLSAEKGTAICPEGGLRGWRPSDPVRAVIFRTWDISRLPVGACDRRSRQITLKNPEPSITHWQSDRRYFLENSLSFCNLPGEWFLDRTKGVVYLRPPAEATTGEPVIEAPRVDRLMRLEGLPGKPVSHIRFTGLTFRYSGCEIPDEGLAGHQAGVEVAAAIEGDFVANCRFHKCRFERLGRNGVWLRNGCRDNRITRCEFRDLAGGAIYVGEDVRQGVRLEHETARNEISNNLVEHCGRVWLHCVGIWVGPASHTRIAHNHLRHLPASGVSVGWTWGAKASMSHHNLVEYNYIHHVMSSTSDGGGIYTLGLQPGTVLRNNVIHDSTGWDGAWWANGIYHDNGSSEMLAENNLIYRIGSFGFQMGLNQRITVRNNIIAFAKYGIYADRSTDMDFERNIIYGARGLLNLRVEAKDFRSDYNVYHNPERGFPHFNPRAKQILGLAVGAAGYTFEKWKLAGREAHSIVADPLFVNPEKGDFSLKPGSPAFKLGIKPIDVSKVGIQKETD